MIINAYQLDLNGKPFGVLETEEWFYKFSAMFRQPDYWMQYLPQDWKFFSIWDIPRNELLCGRTR